MNDREKQHHTPLGSAAGSIERTTVAGVDRAATRWQQWLGAHPRLSVWVGLAADVVRVQGQIRTGLAAAGAAFWLVIALFPAVIAIVSIFGLIATPTQAAKAVMDLGDKGTASLATAVSHQVEQLASNPPVHPTAGLVIALILMVWAVSNGVYNLTRAVGLAAGLPAPNYVRARVRSFVGAVCAVLVLGAVAFVASYLSTLDDQLAGTPQVAVTVFVIAPLTLVLVFGVLVGVYRFAIGPSVRVRGLLPGAALATVGLAVLHAVLVMVVADFGGDSAVYGVAAGLISGLLATYCAIYIVLLGAVVNAALPTAIDR